MYTKYAANVRAKVGVQLNFPG